jgi:helicase MOV-10
VGPIISSQAARDGELDVSLLQRLFERDAYAKHPSVIKASRHLVDMPVVDGAAAYTPFTRLVRVSYSKGMRFVADRAELPLDA